MEGLEAVELNFSFVKSESSYLRIESEYFKKEYRFLKRKLNTLPHTKLLSILSQHVQTGHTPSMKKLDFYGGNIKLIKTDNLRENYIKPNFSHYLTTKGKSRISDYVFEL